MVDIVMVDRVEWISGVAVKESGGWIKKWSGSGWIKKLL